MAKVIRGGTARVWLGDGGCDESKESDGEAGVAAQGGVSSDKGRVACG